MSILDNFFRRKDQASPDESEQAARIAEALAEKPVADWRGSKVMLELLARFFRGADPWKFVGKEHWNDVLGDKVEQVIERLRTEGVLVAAPAALALAHRYSVTDLQYLLSERQQLTNGGKDELIQRLLTSDPDGVRQLTGEINVLILSDEARRHVVRYVRAERERREQAERKSLTGLLQRDVLRAALAVGEYQEESVFSRGVGVAFDDEDHRENVQILQTLFEKTPALLRSVDAEQVDALRPPAGMAFLWGKDSAASWIRKDLAIDAPWPPETIATMLMTHARYQYDRERYRDSKYRTFEIWAKSDAHTCGACSSLRGALYTLDSLPELPHADCTSASGCRCSIVVSEHVNGD